MEDELFLCFINLIGSDVEGNYTYEFLFTKDKENFWVEDGDYKPCCVVNGLIPVENSYSLSKIVKTTIELDLIQDSCCFGWTDCQDGIVPLGYENIDNYETYPDYRLILPYGITYDETIERLAKKDIVFEEKSEE